MAFQERAGKSQRVLQAVRADILSGRLRAGERVRSLRDLAEEFGVSAKSVQVAFDALAEEGLIERRRGSGTFIKPRQVSQENTIYLLAPNPYHITSTHYTGVILRRLLYGATMAAGTGQLVQLLPICRGNVKSIRTDPDAIDWATLEHVRPGSNVFVSDIWYGPIIPYLIERGVRGVFLSKQYECEFPETWALVQETSWPMLTVDRRSAMRQVVDYLYGLGRRRIAVMKRCEQQPQHPFRLGFLDGSERCQLAGAEDRFHEFPPYSSEHDVTQMVVRLFEKTGFDALVVCDPDIWDTARATLKQRLSLSIPEDVAVICYRDMPSFVEQDPAVSAFDFSWVDIGREIVNMFNCADARGMNTRFQASIVERGSTVSGLEGRSVTSFTPEVLPAGVEVQEVV